MWHISNVIPPNTNISVLDICFASKLEYLKLFPRGCTLQVPIRARNGHGWSFKVRAEISDSPMAMFDVMYKL
jgi:hypothetical protein